MEPFLDQQHKISLVRQKLLDGTCTQADLTEAIIAMRAGREAALRSTDTAKRTKAKAAIPTAKDLLSEMDDT